MKHIYLATILVLFFLGIFITLFNQSTTINLPVIKDKKDILDLFAKSDAEINNLVQLAITEANHNINLIYNIKDQDRNFKNTILAFDRMQANFDIKQNVIYILTMVSPDAQLRESAQKATTILSEFALNNFFQNKKLYAALKSYAENHSNKEDLSQSDLYFIKETLKAYKKAGLEKEDSVSEAIKKLSQELTLLSLEFQKNINISNRSIKVTREGLAGLDQDFINSLKQEKPNDKNLKGSNENLYILGVDYPTYFRILEDCSCENTRKALWHEFNLRGYPANKQVLTQIANLRNQLAKLLDFDNYAHMDISDQMAGHPDKVFSFLKEISDKCQGKAQQEIDILKKDLPDSVVLEHNKFKPWDLKFALNYYKKKYLMLDENLISEYFPYEYTIDALFGIYEKFFGLRFEKFSIDGLWHKDVQALKVYKDNKFIGNLLLDLWPRDNKFTHACQVGLVSSVKDKNNKIISPALILVIANFSKPQIEGGSILLRRQEVVTFFHECGHAIHSLLGSTELASHSGTNVKQDFVEMPSQMLEEWMTDREILKLISQHKDTKDNLPDHIIDRINQNKNCFVALSLLGQIAYSLTSINFFNGSNDDIDSIWKESHNALANAISHCSDFGYCSFGHLTGYGSKYYGYLWSSVYAKDLFSKIKEKGLLNRDIGEFYISKVLSQGGSKDPNDLLKDFLGRESNSDAFFKDLGI